MRYMPLLLLQLYTLVLVVWCKLDCDPTSDTKKPDPANPESYLYCNLEGSFSKRKCLSGKIFNVESGRCESLRMSDSPRGELEEDPLSKPFYQAPDDLCGGGIPLTILSAPVACNPSISSCPDGYMCRQYERTGTSYCCQGGSLPSTSSSSIMCSDEQVTFIEPSTGKPRSCVLSSTSSCPTGFGCNLVSGTTTRCCGRDLGCPFNSAAFLHPQTASHVECTPGRRSSCQNGFSCVRSSSLHKNICCSSTEKGTDNAVCPGGESPLARPAVCSASSPCPTGHVCKDGKCCPSTGVCPAGQPLGGGPTVCSASIPCREGYQCVTNGGVQYCCPSREKVCSSSRSAGSACASSRPAVTRFYFDVSTGSCRSFQFSQCGGNSNNFDSLEECEGFCVDSQCSNGQAYRVGAVNAACALSSVNTCPQQHSCQTPLFGPSPICCPTPELTCNEMVSAGTPCFGRSLTIQRFYFNPATRKCQPFQYYGCNGNGNNFESERECGNFCLNQAENVCGGVSALLDPNQQPQRCSSAVPCPAGYDCNGDNYCCPSTQTACGAALSRGNACSGSMQRTMWYYDNAQRKCSQFVYNGCGGTANRFSSEKACNSQCGGAHLGSCPRGMTAYVEEGDVTPKTCTLNVMGTCPSTASCVRSTANQPICCQTVTNCPDNRTPYTIPGSTSIVACNIEADECPGNNVCMESSSIAGFHMCCSTTKSSNNNQRPPAARGRGNGRKEPNTMAALLKSISPCPPQLQSNGQTCTVNAIGECPSGHLCFRDVGFETGSCCRTTPPKCAQKTYVPVFIDKTQVQVCQTDLGGCPRDSRCMTSTVAMLAICCKKYHPPPRNLKNSNSGSGLSAGEAHKCASGSLPYQNGAIVQECNFVQNTCPSGYKCEFFSSGRPVCCGDPDLIKCPHGSSVFEYGGRPLACPAGSTKCPMGYSCLASQNPQYHLCCSTGIVPTVPQCARGVAYVDPATNERRFCSPMANNCPSGYHCFESDTPSQFICCTQGDLNDRFKGFCPPRQIPYVTRDGYPPTCHMQLNPCPTTAPYVCIYSPEKQDSFCCAPIDTAVRSFMPDNVAARPPMNKLAPMPEEQLSGGTVPASAGSGMAGMTQTFPGGPIAPGIGHVAMPDPIPGVSNDRILPPGLVNSKNTSPVMGMNVVNSGNSFVNNGQNTLVNSGHTTGLNQQLQGVITQLTSSLFTSSSSPSSSSFPSTTGCPLGSRPLVRTDRSVAQCADQPCPDGFACVFAETENRFQCCSSSSIMLASSRNAEQEATPTSGNQPMDNSRMECPPGFFMIDGKCLKVLFAGQKGCLTDSQCSAREANSTCDSGYCICPADKPLVHGGKCIASCPEGFANIAGRCYDPTTVIFMDSVDDRANGTIGGYCLETLVEENRCEVENAYCSEKTVTCQCKAGFDLQMNFENKDDKGACREMESSKYAHSEPREEQPNIDDELYFIDIGPAQAVEVTNSTAADDAASSPDDLNKYLFQSDELIPVFA